MTPELISAFGVIITTIFAGFFGLMRYMIKTLAELKPNGGGSIKDQVNINTKRVEKIEERVDNIYEILIKKK
jgi:ribulose 1,5-bisphosphate carboxylase large subunit-like protein